jgi:hypothetical protein
MTEERKFTILERIEATGKNGSEFLILKTNPDKIYVFPDCIAKKH